MIVNAVVKTWGRFKSYFFVLQGRTADSSRTSILLDEFGVESSVGVQGANGVQIDHIMEPSLESSICTEKNRIKLQTREDKSQSCC